MRGCLWMVEGRCVPLAWFSMASEGGLKEEVLPSYEDILGSRKGQRDGGLEIGRWQCQERMGSW